ncbi:MAG: tetratricopeptide repeat protein, partial [Candidatus Eisenbacteria bacterium]
GDMLAPDWPLHEVYAARARARLATADSADAERVFSELRAAGEAALVPELVRERADARRRARAAELLDRSHALAAAGDARGARAALEELAALDAAPSEAWLALAQARWEAGEGAGALHAARRALAGLAGSKRVEALLVAGMAAFQGGDRTAALSAFHEARTWAPADPRTYDYEARVRFATGDAPGARRIVEAGLARVPADPALLQARAALAPRR